MSYVFVGGAVISIGTSFIGAEAGKKQMAAQIQAQKDIASANLASDEKYKYEALRTTAETANLKILADSLTTNRSNLYTQSTQRLSDTKLYVLSLGVGIGIIYGVSLMGSKN